MMYLLNGLPAFAGTFIITGNVVTSGSVTASYFTVTGGTAATCLNGIYQATANSCEVASNGSRAVLFDSTQNATFTGDISCKNLVVGSSRALGWTSSSLLTSPSDGIITLNNQALTGFNRLQFGGTTASFPAVARNSGGIDIVAADGSAFAALRSAGHIISGAAIAAAATQVCYGGTTATTVGAAGGASALPLTPLGYIIVNVAGTTAKIPYYNN